VRRRFLIALAIFAAAHLYIWWRLVWPLPAPWWQAASAMMAVLAPTFPLTMRVWRTLPRERARPWLLVGYLWFGFATYFFLGAVGSHVAVAFGAAARTAAIAGGAASIIVVVAGLLNVARGPVVHRVRIPLRNLAAPYTLVQLTDVHIGPMIGRSFAERMVARVNALVPDAVVITGDLVDGHVAELRPHVEPLRGLRARDGVFAVTGNHEFYWNAVAWLDHLRSLGLRVLRNQHVTLAGAFTLAGVDDWSFGEDVPRAVAGRDPELPVVLLAHHPRTVTEAVAAGVDLQLSGHTHGGQLLPWGWLARLFDPKVSGLARFGDTWLYVSHGTGYWGPPLRVGTRCEITAITLVPA
jgi:uncharacterized protein